MLFQKRTKKAIKYVWGAFSLVIIASMVLTYSGVLYLTSSSAPAPIPTQSAEEAFNQLPPEEQARIRAQLQTTANNQRPESGVPEGTVEDPALLEAIENELELTATPPTDDQEQVPEVPPAPPLNFSVPQ